MRLALTFRRGGETLQRRVGAQPRVGERAIGVESQGQITLDVVRPDHGRPLFDGPRGRAQLDLKWSAQQSLLRDSKTALREQLLPAPVPGHQIPLTVKY